MTAIFDALAESPLLLLFAIIGIGSLVGNLRVAGFSLGPAGVLFTGIFLGSLDARLRVPELVYVFGLVVFAYTIGIQSGPTFFASFGKRAFRANVFSFGAVLLAAILAVAGQRAFGLDGPTMAGVFCGSLTNTPALAASIEVLRQGAGTAAEIQARTSAPVVGYSVAYPFGVVGVLAGLFLYGKFRAARGKEPPVQEPGEPGPAGPIAARTFRVVNPGVIGKTVSSILGDGAGQGFVLSRMRRGDTTTLVYAETTFMQGDLVVGVGDAAALERALMLFGEVSALDIQTENREFDFRRIEVSDKKVVGRAIADLNLQRLLDATITRIRRGDADFVPTGDTVLERGDRVRVITWSGNMERVARFLGDSVRSSSEADFLSLSAGLVAGVLLGIARLPLPGGGSFALGFAGGPLVAGLLLGRLQHSGPVNWGMPYGVNLTLRQLGLVLFLAGIGTRAGDGFLRTVADGGWLYMGAGAALTAVVTVFVLSFGARLLRLPSAAVMGLLSGIQTQPACLAYANEQSGSDLPNVWYASVYPVSMIAKIILAQVMVGWLRM